jgi:hypothetical protein
VAPHSATSNPLGAPAPRTPTGSTAVARQQDWAVALIIALGCHVLWQAHGITTGRFQNLDVAGIVYNARLLLAGRLPYVDSVEIKPPGAFLLFAPWLALGGLRAVWWFSAFWGAMTSLATGWLGALCWGAKWGPRIAVLHAAGAAVAADGDINYSFWMTLPFVLSAVFSVRAAQADLAWRALSSFALAAGLGAFAVLVRPSALTVALVFASAMVPRRRQKSVCAPAMATLAGLVGVGVVCVLVALPFVHGGSLQAMIHGYSSVRQYADESVTSILVGAGGRLAATLNGLQCLPDQLPVYHLLLAVALLPTPSAVRKRDARPFGYLAWTFALASFVGISLTLRFFTHDNAPIWPALAVLILRPTSLVGIAVEWLAQYRKVDLATAFGIGLLAPLSNWQSLTWLQNHMHQSDAQVAALCKKLAPRLSAHDTVLAWGWTAWGVYEHCGRWAPGPVYKDLTTVTTPNTNTCNRGYEPPRLKHGPFTQRFLQDLEQRQPALIIVSDYYRGLGGDPLDGWIEARRFLRENYVVYDTLGGFQALLRRDVGLLAGLPHESAPAIVPPSDATAAHAVCVQTPIRTANF